MVAAHWSPAAILLLLCVLPASAQVADPLPANSATAESGPTESSSADVPKPSSGCGGEAAPDTAGLDTMRAGLERGVCSTARFVDRLFGGDREFAEYDDEIGVFNPVVGAFSDDDPAEWFAGVGYRGLRTRDSSFDLGAGVKLRSPLNPYANARYRHYIYGSPGVLLTLRTTAFVENDEGFGVTQAIDVDKVLSPEYLLRISNSVRMSEETQGVRWRIRPALYQTIDYRRAMRYEAFVRGETDGDEPDLYGAGITYRRSMWRDWFFVEFGAELFWADGPEPADRCHSCVGGSIGFEILFGDLYDRRLRRDARRLPAGEESGPTK